MTNLSFRVDRLYLRHPYAAPFITFIAAPIAVIIAVLSSLTAILFPAALLLGWL